MKHYIKLMLKKTETFRGRTSSETVQRQKVRDKRT